jgi:hypothetical protein
MGAGDRNCIQGGRMQVMVLKYVNLNNISDNKEKLKEKRTKKDHHLLFKLQDGDKVEKSSCIRSKSTQIRSD